MIDGAAIHTLRRIPDERGQILHMLRSDAAHFAGFGEIYFSQVYPGVVKAWHIHSKMSLNYAVPIGSVKLVLYDDRPGSTTHGEVMEVFMGESNYVLVTVPPGVWNGFKGIGVAPALVANCSTHPHDPAEISRLDPFDNHIPYDWGLKNG
jgi:dTDP-4-dehydrorhamnose 3,5-epimerase